MAECQLFLRQPYGPYVRKLATTRLTPTARNQKATYVGKKLSTGWESCDLSLA